MNLVIIEGVGKQDTIKKYLGSNFEVVATKGHIRDLPEKSLGVNVNDNFKPQYVIMPDKEDIVKKLKAKSAKAEHIYLATDPDREGESISWHLAYVLNLNPDDPIRIEFNEISKNAVTNAVKNPRGININLVNAQQARRVLDRLLGYKLSPVLCKKIQPNLSAGRVQSVALKMIVDREREINNFVKEEYWTLVAKLFKNSIKDLFKSSLIKFKNKKVEIHNKEEMDKVLDDLKQNKFIVSSVKKSLTKVHPSAPYTTSTMQQDALNKLGMNLKKASMCAQELYEGVSIGNEGKTALITYIRTDSVRVSPEAMKMAKDYIEANYGNAYVPKTPNIYKVKKSAQDAHEAIRPISLDRTPESVKQYLTPDNYKLYNMIYKKFLASQMAEATFDTITADIQNGEYTFHSTGKTPVFDGFNAVYRSLTAKQKEKEENDEEEDESENSNLPELNEGDVLNLNELLPAQKFTKPLPRFTEATLVKEMESKGIGRPATYTPTIMVLSNRKYTEKEGKFLKPTELAFKVSDLLNKYFDNIIDVKFTAMMEDLLDEVANSGRAWQDIVAGFYAKFMKRLLIADKDSATFKEPPKPTEFICEKCGHPMVIRTGRFGEFMACSNYPQCKNIQNIAKDSVGTCPKCGGKIFEKKSKKGKIFYGCENYPKCDFASWEQPTSEKCPKCGAYLTKKDFYNNTRYKCSNEKCDYTLIEKKVKNDEKSTEESVE